MLIQVNAADVHSSEALTQAVNDDVHAALKHVEHQITRIEAHLHDDSAHSHKHGANDKRCTLEARIAGRQPMTVEESSDDLYKSIHLASQKLGRAVTHTLDKR
ncbi:MAG: HPF/RaiA family ribosome-associated protein [Algisphaera sp.]